MLPRLSAAMPIMVTVFVEGMSVAQRFAPVEPEYFATNPSKRNPLRGSDVLSVLGIAVVPKLYDVA